MAPKRNQKGLVSAMLAEMKGLNIAGFEPKAKEPKAKAKAEPKAKEPKAEAKAEAKPKAKAKKLVVADAVACSVPLAKKKTLKVVSSEASKYGRRGQTKETPPPKDGLRKFYTSLLAQRPDSAMAMRWCLEHGLIPEKQIDEIVLSLEMAANCKIR